jgi:dolichol-phosphate mannosyltransferase
VSAEEGPWPPLGIVVPVYNEEASIERGLRALTEVADRYEGRAEIIAVDDGSADGSLEVLERVAEQIDLIGVVRHESNRGYGAALRTGAAAAREKGLDYAAFIDSDLTNPPGDLLKIGRLAAEGHAYIKASRFVPGGGMVGVSIGRRSVSRAGNLVGAALFRAGIRDVTNGFRAVRLSDHARWPLSESGFASIVEELYWAQGDGLRPVEFPSVLTARTGEQRRSAFPYSAALIRSYLRYPVRAFLRRLAARGPRRSP